MEHDDELHQKGRSGHLLGLLVEECEDVALVVGNQAQPSTEQSFASHRQKEVPNISRVEIRRVGHHLCEPTHGQPVVPGSGTTMCPLCMGFLCLQAILHCRPVHLDVRGHR